MPTCPFCFLVFRATDKFYAHVTNDHCADANIKLKIKCHVCHEQVSSLRHHLLHNTRAQFYEHILVDRDLTDQRRQVAARTRAGEILHIDITGRLYTPNFKREVARMKKNMRARKQRRRALYL